MQALFKKVLSRDVLPTLVAVGALTAFALGYLGSMSAAFDLFAQFTAHWLVIAVTAVVASFATRRAYALLAASLVTACVLPAGLMFWYSSTNSLRALVPATFVAPSLASPGKHGAERTPAEPRRIKLLSYNTYNLNRKFDAIWREIKRHDADVLVLIEFGPNKQPLKSRLLKHYPYHKSCEADWNCAIGLFSRLPARNFKLVTPNDDAGPPYISAEIELGGTAVTIVGTHILSPNHGPRANFIELDHLSAMARRRHKPMIVTGDLNTTIWANAFDNFRRKSGLNHMGHLIPTWPVRPLPLPQLGIDHVFTSPELLLTNIATGRPAGSDHVPLIATIELK